MSQYTVYVLPQEFRAIKRLPGNVRHRIRRAIETLADDPRPSSGRQLDTSEIDDFHSEVWRIRLADWRVIYIVAEQEKTVDVVAVRKRPPYDYGDLSELLKGHS